jgi:hypothetical protein
MRITFTIFLALAFYTQGSMAQRPWIFAYPDNTPTNQLAVASNILYTYGEFGLAYSIDHGTTWDTVEAVGPHVRGITDFFSGVSLCVTQLPGADSASFYFSTNGTSWTFSENLNVGKKTVVDLGARGQRFYVATKEGMLYARGVTLDSLTITEATDVSELVVASTYLAALSKTGIHYSSDEGATWSRTSTPQASGSPVTPAALLDVNAVLYTATSDGIHAYQASANTWSNHGTWPDTLSNRNVLAIAADGLRMLAMLYNNQSQLQMYRLTSADTMWTETGWALPQQQIDPHRNMLVIENGWAVLHQTSVEPNDSLGYYQYDLNDFTSVSESPTNDGVTIYTSTNGITINTPFHDGFTVSFYDLLGNDLSTHSSTTSSTTTTTTSPTTTTLQPLFLVIRSTTGTLVRRLIMY